MLTILGISEREHELVHHLLCVSIAKQPYQQGKADLGVLEASKARFIWSLGEAKTWQTRGNDVEAGVLGRRRAKEG